MLKLDLACGQRCHEGFTGVDIVAQGTSAEIIADLRRSWPWEDGSVEEAICQHFFEHLTGAERMDFMDQLYRVLVPGGTATIITPYAWSWRAVADPTHQWPPIVEQSYLYYNKTWRVANKLDHYPIYCDFEFEIRYVFNPDVSFPDEAAHEQGLRHYLNVVDDLRTVLTRVP